MYFLDTNVFINAKNFYYQFDIHPGFWDWLLISNLGCEPLDRQC